MSTIYLVYIPERGWWTKASGYSSEIKDAKEFTHTEAIDFCKKRYNPVGALGGFPVAEADIAAVSTK